MPTAWTLAARNARIWPAAIVIALSAGLAPAIADPAIDPATNPSAVLPSPAEPDALDHRDCAGAYGALSLALPYAPGILLMFTIAPRTGVALNAYNKEAKPVSKRAVRQEGERRKDRFLAAFKAGEATLEQLIALAHACDAKYGLDPFPVTFDKLLQPK